jgi:hypothetical protein
MLKLLKSPQVHFLLIGLFLFVLHHLFFSEPVKEEILIDQYVISELTQKWKKESLREPTVVELKGLIDLYVRQEVLYRKALEMKLDHNDEIIKRRLAKKVVFLSDDLAKALSPSDIELKEYYQQNSDTYNKPSSFTFEQLYFSRDNGKDPMANVKEVLLRGITSSDGDPISLPRKMVDKASTLIAVEFGSTFANSLDSLPLGEWTGPVKSGFGIHIVKVEQKKRGEPFPFEAVKKQISLDYNFKASKRFRNELVTTYLKEYNVVFKLDNAETENSLENGRKN